MDEELLKRLAEMITGNGFASPMPTFGGRGLPSPQYGAMTGALPTQAAPQAQNALLNIARTPLDNGPFNSRKPTFAGPSTTSVGSGGGGGYSLPVMTPVANRPLHERAAAQIMNSPDFNTIQTTAQNAPVTTNVITGTSQQVLSDAAKTVSPSHQALVDYFGYLSSVGLNSIGVPGAPHVPITGGSSDS